MTKERKIYIVILAAALAGLAWDRLHQSELSGPETVRAEAEKSAPQVPRRFIMPDNETRTTDLPSPPQRHPGTWSPENLVDDRLIGRENHRSLNVRDLFMATDNMQMVLQGPEKTSNEAAEPAGSRNLVLNSVMVSPDNPAAMINDKIYRIGDTIGPFQLTHIFPRAVVLKTETDRYILYLRQ